MANLQEIRGQIEQDKQRAKQQRQEITQRKKEARQAEKQIQSEREKLPAFSQERLRQGLYSGLEGRKRRREISKAREFLGQKEKGVKQFQEDVSKFEKKQLLPFEQNIQEREKEATRIEKEQRAIKTAGDVIAGLTASFALRDPLVRKYYEMMEAGQTPTVKKEVSPSKESKGDPRPVVEGKRVGFSPDPKQFTQIGSTPGGGGIWERRDKIRGVQSFSFPTPRTSITRTQKLKDFNQLSTIDPKKITESVSSVLNRNFRTTGSPLRMTKITSPKSKGYTPEPVNMMALKTRTQTKQPSIIQTKSPGIDIFGKKPRTSKTKKKKKKVDIWGL